MMARKLVAALPLLALACAPEENAGRMTAAADNDLIYGADDRKEVRDASKAERGAAAAVAVLFRKSTELSCSGSACSLLSLPYASFFSPPLCRDEPFRDQNTLGFCTGFLVGPDLVATAGHCVTKQSDCNGIALYFNFIQPAADQSPLSVPARDVYSCGTLVARKQTSKNDWAVIRLDRSVAGVKPLCIRRQGTAPVGTAVEVIGHPFTLPKKVAGGAQVKGVASAFFTANLDTYGGNSGSPVLDATMTVQGILVRGNPDYALSEDAQGACIRSNVCPDTGCNGTFEEVTHAANIAASVPAVACYVP
jgi:V8-like Glu-specific endopeptidase